MEGEFGKQRIARSDIAYIFGYPPTLNIQIVRACKKELQLGSAVGATWIAANGSTDEVCTESAAAAWADSSANAGRVENARMMRSTVAIATRCVIFLFITFLA